jgi:polysaccharide export outer membrane protein
LLAALALAGGGCHSTGPLVAPPPDGAVPTELKKVTLPPYVIEPPDQLIIEVLTAPPAGQTQAVQLSPQPISGSHTVRMDGTVGLGIYGSVALAGLTLDQAQEVIRQFIAKTANVAPDQLYVIVDVMVYSSKFYYVITDGAGYGEQVYPFPITGSETVLDAVGRINGLPAVASKREIWVARRNPNGPNCADQILPVDWVGITQHGITLTNYQVMPGDRIYVQSQKILRIDSALAKFLSPLERITGYGLLLGNTIQSFGGFQNGGGGGTNNTRN